MIKTIEKPWIKGNILNMIKNIASIKLRDERLKVFLLRSWTRQRYLLSQLLINTILVVADREIRLIIDDR
jgi:hypothetical protein